MNKELIKELERLLSIIDNDLSEVPATSTHRKLIDARTRILEARLTLWKLDREAK